jgi:hypothetical protein
VAIRDPCLVEIWPEIAINDIFGPEAEPPTFLVAHGHASEASARVALYVLKTNEQGGVSGIVTGVHCVSDEFGESRHRLSIRLGVAKDLLGQAGQCRQEKFGRVPRSQLIHYHAL